MSREPAVTVVGSINLDVIVRVRRLPGDGETILATDRAEGLGGKGANQAIAVARAGVTSRFIGAVGGDVHGPQLQEILVAAGVDVAHLSVVDGVSSGTAFVFVDEVGENLIVVDQGANDRVTLTASALESLGAAAVLVVQNEVPADVVAAAVATAKGGGARVVVNLAPFRPAPEVVAVADPLVVNEHEAAELLGRPMTGADDVVAAREEILGLCRSAIVTLGAAGAVLLSRDDVVVVPAPAPARVVDTTGAGDAFVGVLAAGLARGLPLQTCVEAAAAAGSRSVETRGAGSGYPSFELPDD